jgi:ligand-binding SRPBCC domain-containing protein
VEKVFAFHADAANLLKITPPDSHVKIIGGSRIYLGAKIHLKVTVPVLGESDWESEITEFWQNESFTDEQVRGPFKRWKHKHVFQPIEGGTRITDIVDYEVPFGLIGALVSRSLVERQLREMFAYRQEKTKELLEANDQ